VLAALEVVRGLNDKQIRTLRPIQVVSWTNEKGSRFAPAMMGSGVFADALTLSCREEADPLWRMPLWSPYDDWLKSKIADLNHISEGGHAGSITAALFLRRFVEKARTHVHFDVFAWNPRARAGRPVGGEAQGIRALFALLRKKYP